jgi:TolB protein
MKYQLLNVFKLFLILSISSFSTTAFAELDIEISGGSAQQIPVAIVPFGQENSQRAKISQIVGADLSRSGLFKILETRGMVDLPSSASQINFPQWQALQAQALAVGNIEPLNSRQLRVTFELIDVFKQTRLMALEYTVAPAQLRMTAHKIADEIYTKLTGEGGMFASRIAYINKTSSRYSLMVADVDGANPTAVAFSKEPIISPSWSPDGSRIAYVSFERKKPIIYIQSLKTGKRFLLANFKGNNSAPAWSPDGTKLAIVLTYASNSQIYTINADGSGVKQVVNSNSIDTEPTWSKDGRAIYFTSSRGGRPQIYKVSSAGGAVSRVTFEGTYNVSPALSPDGRYLATIRKDGGSFKVALQDLTTGQVQLLSQGAKDESPSFSPNGRVLLYATSRGGRGSLAAVSSDGNARQRLKESGGDVREPAWGPLIK